MVWSERSRVRVRLPASAPGHPPSPGPARAAWPRRSFAQPGQQHQPEALPEKRSVACAGLKRPISAEPMTSAAGSRPGPRSMGKSASDWIGARVRPWMGRVSRWARRSTISSARGVCRPAAIRRAMLPAGRMTSGPFSGFGDAFARFHHQPQRFDPQYRRDRAVRFQETLRNRWVPTATARRDARSPCRSDCHRRPRSPIHAPIPAGRAAIPAPAWRGRGCR